MTRITVRKSGGANIVSIPTTILKMLQLHPGSILDISLEDNKIILSPVAEELTLDDLLAGSPKKRLNLKKEDKEWVKTKLVGKEL